MSQEDFRLMALAWAHLEAMGMRSGSKAEDLANLLSSESRRSIAPVGETTLCSSLLYAN